MRMKMWSALALSFVGGLLGTHAARAQTCVAWVAGGTYSAGEVVTYNGATYTSEVQQTDQVGSGWNPTIVGLFSPGGSCSGGAPPSTTPALGITSGASYNIVNPSSGLVLDVAGCGNVNGTAVDLWAKGVNVCNNGTGQVWSPTLNSDNTYTLTNPASSLVLDVAGCGTANGTAVDIWANGIGTCDGGAGQKWAIEMNSDGTYTLLNPLTDNVLDVSGCGETNGTRVQTWANGVGVCDNGAGQKWQFVTPATTTTPPPPPPSGTGKIVGGYYPWWVGSPVRLINVPSVYNVIYLFAATTSGGGAETGAVTFTLPADGNGAATNWAADIQTARNVQHRKIILSVGGAGYAMAFPNRAYSQTFLDSVEALYNAWGGFDGLDWDTFEGISPDVSEMIWVSQQLKAAHPGFIISAPPAPWNTSDQQLCVSMLQAGALDYCAPQYYDGPNLADPSWILPNVDVWMTLIPQKNFVFGFGIDPNLSNYETIAVGLSVWQSISAKYPSIGGAFDWQINEDLLNGGPFADQLAPLVNPGGAPANVP